MKHRRGRNWEFTWRHYFTFWMNFGGCANFSRHFTWRDA